ITDPQIACLLLPLCPFCRVNKALSQQIDVKAKFRCARVSQFLLGRKQVEKKRSQSGVVQCARDELIARTMPTASAALSEKRQRGGIHGNIQIASENGAASRNMNFMHCYGCNPPSSQMPMRS